MKLKGNVVFNAILLILFAAAFFISMRWPDKARLYPMIITAGGICFAGFLVFVGITGKDAAGNEKKVSPKEAAKEKLKRLRSRLGKAEAKDA